MARDSETGLDRDVYRSEGHIPYEVALSPSGRYAAFLEVTGSGDAMRRRLVVVSLSGGVVRVLGESAIHGDRGIQQYTWCCGAERLAIITGLVGEAVRPMDVPMSESLYVFHLQTGTQEAIEGLPRPLQAAWSTFDSSLYVLCAPEVRKPGPETWPVYRYDVQSGALSRTTRRGIFFSPDGKYYFDTGWNENSGFRLYRTADDRDVTAQLAVARHHLGFDATWMPGARHQLVFVENPAPQAPRTQQQRRPARISPVPPRPRVYPDRWNLIVDAATGRIVERFQGDIRSGWKSSAAVLPVERRTGVELVRPRRP